MVLLDFMFVTIIRRLTIDYMPLYDHILIELIIDIKAIVVKKTREFYSFISNTGK